MTTNGLREYKANHWPKLLPYAVASFNAHAIAGTNIFAFQMKHAMGMSSAPVASPMPKTTQVTRFKSPRLAVGHPEALKDFHHEIKKLCATLYT